MIFDFEGTILFWRGPAPYWFVPVPDGPSAVIQDLSSSLSYGWGVIPVRACIGNTEWKTSLIPKDGRYLVPVKQAVQAAEGLQLGDTVHLKLTLG